MSEAPKKPRAKKQAAPKMEAPGDDLEQVVERLLRAMQTQRRDHDQAE